jgi:hypothetical protein
MVLRSREASKAGCVCEESAAQPVLVQPGIRAARCRQRCQGRGRARLTALAAPPFKPIRPVYLVPGTLVPVRPRHLAAWPGRPPVKPVFDPPLAAGRGQAAGSMATCVSWATALPASGAGRDSCPGRPHHLAVLETLAAGRQLAAKRAQWHGVRTCEFARPTRQMRRQRQRARPG